VKRFVDPDQVDRRKEVADQPPGGGVSKAGLDECDRFDDDVVVCDERLGQQL
jgi:hypothetical protein